MSPNPIPTSSRRAVRERDHDRCVRCGGHGSEWHHRRTRSVRDAHQHCTCVGILLCAECHRWVHAHPKQATEQGLIVSRHQASPFTIPFRGRYGWVQPDCAGELTRP